MQYLFDKEVHERIAFNPYSNTPPRHLIPFFISHDDTIRNRNLPVAEFAQGL